MESLLRCTTCHQRLERGQHDYRCVNGHLFDIARQGYVNLLLSHQMRSKEPGDSVQMVQSRRKFLNRGFYDSVSAALNEIVGLNALGQRSGFINVLDAGCGEGFYTKRLKDFLGLRFGAATDQRFYGVDISKPAIRMATQHDRAITWVVASVLDLPVMTSTLDLVMSVFAVPNYQEFSRVLKEDGKLVMVTPGPRHLLSLRKIIYTEVFEHSLVKSLRGSEGLFSRVDSTAVAYRLVLDDWEDIMNLLTMTPYYWNINLEQKGRVEALTKLDLEVDVLVSVLKKV